MRTVGETSHYCKYCGYDTGPPDRDGNADVFCPSRDGDFCEPKKRIFKPEVHRRLMGRGAR